MIMFKQFHEEYSEIYLDFTEGKYSIKRLKNVDAQEKSKTNLRIPHERRCCRRWKRFRSWEALCYSCAKHSRHQSAPSSFQSFKLINTKMRERKSLNSVYSHWNQEIWSRNNSHGDITIGTWTTMVSISCVNI